MHNKKELTISDSDKITGKKCYILLVKENKVFDPYLNL